MNVETDDEDFEGVFGNRQWEKRCKIERIGDMFRLLWLESVITELH